MNSCGHLCPFSDSFSTGLNHHGNPCLLPEHHQGEHLFMRHDGRFIAWEMDDACGCPPEEECECYVSRSVGFDEAVQTLLGVPYLVQPLLNNEKGPPESIEDQFEFDWY